MPKLTKALVDKTQAPAKGDISIWDTELEGFGIRIQSSGRKTYVMRYRAKDANKTQRKMTLARACDMPPEKAREMARKEFARIAEGHDPAADRKPKVQAADAVEPTKTASVGQMFEAYVASMRAKNRDSADEVERALLLAKNNAADALGRDKPAAGVKAIDVVNYVSMFYQAGHRGAADKHRSYIASAYTWAMKSANDYTAVERQDWGIERNPAADVAKDPGAIKTVDRNLSASELRRLWKATEFGAEGFSPEIAICIRMIVLCGQRVQETLRIDGADIDLKAGLWRMPAHKTKGRKHVHTIPLPQQAIPLLADLIARHGDGPLFAARTGSAGEQILHRSVNHALGRWLDRLDVNLEHFTTRDLRRTWKSRAHDAGVDRFTRDLIQQHAKNDTGTKSYDRADYLPQMKEAMAKWGAWLELVTSGGPLPSAQVMKLAA